jgi:flagellar M-ring protein FliF
MTRHTIQPAGDIARLSVAVILDDDQVFTKNAEGATTAARKPRTREELQKIHGLVAAAVGLDLERGDQLTVENVAFDEPPVEEVVPSVLERYSPQIWEGSRMLIVAVLGLVAFLVLVRPLVAGAGVRSAAVTAAAGAGALPIAGHPPRTVAEIESEIEAQLDAAAAERLESRKLPALTRRVSTISAQNPESVAKLLRSWIAQPER